MAIIGDVTSFSVLVFFATVEQHKLATGHDPLNNFVPTDCVVCSHLNAAFKLLNDEQFPFADLQGFWPMSEASGTRVDLTASGNDLLEVAGAVNSGTGLVYPLAAKFVQGTTDYLSVSGATELDVHLDDFTIALWCRILGYGSAVVGPRKVAAGVGYSMVIGGEHQGIVIEFGSASVIADAGVGSEGIPVDEWFLVRYEADRDGDLSLYVNELLIATDDISAGVADDVDNSSAAFTVGLSTIADGVLVGPVMVWNRLLTGAEGAYLFNNGLGRPYPQ